MVFRLPERFHLEAMLPRATSPLWLGSQMIAGFSKSRPQFSQGTAVVLFWTATAVWWVLSFPNSTRWGLPQQRVTFLRTSISPSRLWWRQHFLTHSASIMSTVRRLVRYQRRT